MKIIVTFQHFVSQSKCFVSTREFMQLPHQPQCDYVTEHGLNLKYLQGTTAHAFSVKYFFVCDLSVSKIVGYIDKL